MTSDLPFAAGSFVVHDAHPEHGLGRVLTMTAFVTRVFFQNAGLRVFRVDEWSPLKLVIRPPVADVTALKAKEAAMQGHRDASRSGSGNVT